MITREAGRFAAISVAIAAGVFLPQARASSPLTLSYETRVTVDFQLTLVHPPGTPVAIKETLTARAGETIAFAKELQYGETPFIAALTFIVEPVADDASCRLRIDAEVHPGSTTPVRVQRDTNLASGRLLLMDIWSDEAAGAHLILTVSAKWEHIPQLAALLPGAEPVELLLEVLERNGDRYDSLETNRLASIVGSSVTYTFQRRENAFDDAEDSAAKARRLVIEILPESITDGEVLLRVRMRHARGGLGAGGPELDTTLSERLPPGFSLDLPLAGRAGETSLVFRVTPYF